MENELEYSDFKILKSLMEKWADGKDCQFSFEKGTHYNESQNFDLYVVHVIYRGKLFSEKQSKFENTILSEEDQKLMFIRLTQMNGI